MKVLSLFDGISCGQVALKRAGIQVTNYFASEIDKHAIKVTQHNHPDTVQIGDVSKVKAKDLPKIDLLIGGSPCQGFSLAGKQLNFDDPRSKLFFEFVRLLKECKPKYWLLENVVMRQDYEGVISNILGVRPIKINSSLVSAQNRSRVYWSNIQGITPPLDKGITLADILDKTSQSCIVGQGVLSRHKIKTKDQLTIKGLSSDCQYIKTDKKLNIKKNQNKASCLTGGANSGGNHSDMDILVFPNNIARRYTVNECERLQTLPDGYTSTISPSQAYKALGNGWTVDIVAHIFKNITA